MMLLMWRENAQRPVHKDRFTRTPGAAYQSQVDGSDGHVPRLEADALDGAVDEVAAQRSRHITKNGEPSDDAHVGKKQVVLRRTPPARRLEQESRSSAIGYSNDSRGRKPRITRGAPIVTPQHVLDLYHVP